MNATAHASDLLWENILRAFLKRLALASSSHQTQQHHEKVDEVEIE